MGEIDWGDAPTWLGACFAALAAGAAVWTLKSQRDQIGEQRRFIAEQSANLALEREELRAVAEGRRRAQAEQVELQRHPLLRLFNASSAPLHDVVMLFGAEQAVAAVEAVITEGVPFARSGRESGVPVAVIGAGRTFRFAAASDSTPDTPVRVLFTDDNGVRWSLDEHGQLAEVPPEPQA